MKEIQLRPRIEKHDLKVKAKKAKQFLEKNERIKIVVRFKGRQHHFMDELGPNTLNSFLENIEEKCEKKNQKFTFNKIPVRFWMAAPKLFHSKHNHVTIV